MKKMSKKFLKGLKEYSKNAIAKASSRLVLDEVCYDHICYQTKSSQAYEDFLEEIENDIEVIKQIPHSGRRITIANLKDGFLVDKIEINKIEISEPKPKRSVKENKFDHIAFTVKDDFDEFVSKIKQSNTEITEEKRINKDRLVKFTVDNIEVEIRNNRIGEEDCEEEKKEKEKESGDSGEIEELKKKLAEETEKKLRALADYQNLLKRVEKEKDSTTLLASISILGKLLDILDDFDRALEKTKVDEKDQVGLRMVKQKIQDIVDEHGLVEIECQKGDKLNPDFFEAVGIVAVDSKDLSDTVQQIVQKGYKMKDRDIVVRPVRVIVGKFNEENEKN